MTGNKCSPIISDMAKQELRGPDGLFGRLNPGIAETQRILLGEFPDETITGYQYTYEFGDSLIERERNDLVEENAGVLMVVRGRLVPDRVLIPGIVRPTAQRGGEEGRSSVVMPIGIAKRIQELDTQKPDERIAASDLHGIFFLQSVKALLSDKMQGVPVHTDPDLLQNLFASYFTGLLDRGQQIGKEDIAQDHISKIATAVTDQPFERFGIVVSGGRVSVLFNGEPFFTDNYGVDDIFQNLIANALFPKFQQRMGKANRWYKSNSKFTGLTIPELNENDVLLQTAIESGLGISTKRMIREYLSGDLGKKFYGNLSARRSAQLTQQHEAAFQETFGDSAKKEDLARQLRDAMIGGSGEPEVDYSDMTFEDLPYFDADLEEDPEISQRIRQAQKKRLSTQRFIED